VIASVAESSRTDLLLAKIGTRKRVTRNAASQRRSRINKPAAIARTASTVLTVGEIRTLNNGKSPVRINQTASKIIPRFLPARVIANGTSSSLTNV